MRWTHQMKFHWCAFQTCCHSKAVSCKQHRLAVKCRRARWQSREWHRNFWVRTFLTIFSSFFQLLSELLVLYHEQWEITVDGQSIDTSIYIYFLRSASTAARDFSAHEIMFKWFNYLVEEQQKLLNVPNENSWALILVLWREEERLKIRFNYTRAKVLHTGESLERSLWWDDDEHHVIRFLSIHTVCLLALCVHVCLARWSYKSAKH